MSGTLVPSNASTDLPQLGGAPPAQSWGPPPAAADEGGGINLGRYISALKRYKWLIVAITIVGTIAGIGISQFIDPSYEVNATVWVSDPQSGKGPIRAPNMMDAQQWTELLGSFAILDPVAMEMRLYIQPNREADSTVFRTFQPTASLRTGTYGLEHDGKTYKLLNYAEAGDTQIEAGAVGDSIGRPVGFSWAPTAQELGRPRTIVFDVLSPREAALQIKSRLTLRNQTLSNFITLNYTGNKPQRLANTLNLMLSKFVDKATYYKKRELTEFSTTLADQLDVAQRNLKTAENNLEGFKIATIVKPSEQPVVGGTFMTTPPAIKAYQDYRVLLDDTRNDREALETIVREAKEGRISPEALVAVPSVLKNSPQLGSALADLNAKQAALRALKQKYTDEHDLVKRAQAEVSVLETQTIPLIALGTLTSLQRQEADLGRRISSSGAELQKIPARTVEEMRLTREVNVADNLYTNLKQRYQEARLAEASAVPDVQVLDSAQAPLRPSSNTAPGIIGLGIVGGLGLGLVLAILLDLVDKRFRYPDQATKELGLDILGGVPTIRRTKSGQMRIEEASQLVEAFRALRLNVRNAVENNGPVMLTVSSPGAGDGKSLISSNLALSFAESGYRTLLVDGDIRRGQLHTMFGVTQRPGLVDHLTGEATLDEVIRETPHRNMYLIPCGTRRHRGPELLAADGAAKLLRMLAQRFDAVIVDTAPLGAGIDPFALGAATGNMVVVLRTGRTDRKLAHAKLSTLDRLPVRLIGAVLNDIQADGMYKYYAYLDGYGTLEDDDVPALAGNGNGNGTHLTNGKE
jgi:capsular exopolysaccharide synthesis family protein